MYSKFRTPPGGGTTSCVYLATVLSFIDLIPFFYIFGRPPPHLNKSSPPHHPPMSFDTNNQQEQRSQAWSQLFAKCSYHQNQSEKLEIVCFKVFDPLPVFFFTVAFVLAVILLIFNLITMNRNLTNIQRIFRTIIHAIYTLGIFLTTLVYYINRYWCFDCKELLFICLIPILTTMFMPCNWHQCHDGQQIQLQTIRRENERVHFLNPPTDRLAPSPMIMICAERPSPPPCRPTQNNTDPRLENEYNDWLEDHRKNTSQQQQT